MNTKDDEMTLIQAEARYGIAANTLRLAIYRKRLVATKRGRDWFVTAKAIAEWQRNKSPRGRRPKIGA